MGFFFFFSLRNINNFLSKISLELYSQKITHVKINVYVLGFHKNNTFAKCRNLHKKMAKKFYIQSVFQHTYINQDVVLIIKKKKRERYTFPQPKC